MNIFNSQICNHLVRLYDQDQLLSKGHLSPPPPPHIPKRVKVFTCFRVSLKAWVNVTICKPRLSKKYRQLDLLWPFASTVFRGVCT
jgi:hypothetical protein